MKPENNWLYKTLENLEKDKWRDYDFETRLVRRCHELRKIPLDNFTVEDLRIMIGQQIGLDYLVLIALDKLKENLWAEGDYFEGDLLKNVLEVPRDFWKKNKNLWLKLCGLIDGKKAELEEMKIDVLKFYQSNP
ncbi:MAG TPA: contact-dependent growth inhibition system immunity protein [Mucilaginibacter sp.]|jgi:hypothetical protein|nr:contact-dependent growth inhibition system immunity protein [Mucilaginibacter sp.]